MLGILGALKIITYFFVQTASAEASQCMAATEIRAVMDDFELRMQPLLATSPRAIEIRHNNFSLLAGDPVSGSTEFPMEGPIIVRITGEKCENFLHRDELRLLLCHELGHAMGGPPYMKFLGHTNTFASAEGQADYFAAASCLPALFADDDNSAFLEQANIYPELENLCPGTMADSERALCMRIISTSFRFSQFIHATPAPISTYGGGSEGPAPRMDQPSKNIANETLVRAYPSVQCRFDTMVAGFKCRARELIANFTQDPSLELSCGETAENATRPACWYKVD